MTYGRAITTKPFDPFQYLDEKHYKEFDGYTPQRGVHLTAAQVHKLQSIIRLLPVDKYMLLYFWRFVFGVDIKTIRQYANIEYANGIIEALRFACKRFLVLDKPISNIGMAKVFEQMMPEYEIILVSASKGICWFSGKALDARLIREAVEEKEKTINDDL